MEQVKLNTAFGASGNKIKTDRPVTLHGKTFFLQTNADSEDIRVCCPHTKKPYPRAALQRDVTYPLLAYYRAGNPVYYKNARVMGAYNTEEGTIMDVEMASWGVGIYVEAQDKAPVVDFSAFAARRAAKMQPK